MSKLLDLSGKRFGRLTAISKAESPHNDGKTYWLCQCDCGNTIVVRKDSLQSGHVKSCGCLYKEINPILHKHSKDRIYHIWSGMKQRCYNKNDSSYENYGGRGIIVCDEWRDDFLSFYNWAIANGYDKNAPRGECTIDRIEVNGNYEPSNCRWTNQSEQNYNQRETRKVLINGKEMTLKDISDEYNIPITTVRNRYQRYKKGFLSIEELVYKNKLINKPQQILITVNGVTRNLTEWEKDTGVCRKTIIYRYKKGARSYEELFKKSR